MLTWRDRKGLEARNAVAAEAIDYRAVSEVFTDVYDRNVWGKGSGASSPDITRPYMRMLVDFMRNNRVRSVVDVGCGDWQFSREIDWSGIRYRGFDVVEHVIAANARAFGSESVTFHLLRSLTELPRADLVVCKDVLQHLPVGAVQAHLDYFLRTYAYAIVTNDIFPEQGINSDIAHGACRSLRLDLPPFNRRVASLVQWKIETPQHVWIKSACLLMPG